MSAALAAHVAVDESLMALFTTPNKFPRRADYERVGREVAEAAELFEAYAPTTRAGIEAFAREMGVDFYPAGRGIGHQIMAEEGFVLPGTLVVGSDSHSNLYGGLGALDDWEGIRDVGPVALDPDRFHVGRNWRCI
mgnify:CR=1 FL=1